MTRGLLRWGNGIVDLALRTELGKPASLVWMGSAGTAPKIFPDPEQPLVEIFAVGAGHANHNLRHTASAIGKRLEFVAAQEHSLDGVDELRITQTDPATELRIVSTLRAFPRVGAIQAQTQVINEGQGPVVLQAVTSLVTSAFAPGDLPLDDIDVFTASSEWLAEGRWQRIPLRSQQGLVDLDLPRHEAQDARSRWMIASQGTWSSGEKEPTGLVENRATGEAWAWQIEHSGGWLVELSERLGKEFGELALGLLGPTDTQHHWVLPLQPGEDFTSVPVSVAVSEGGWQLAVEELTKQRRAIRRKQSGGASDNYGLPVVFNDYMNTLMGDPTTEKLLPLIDAAAESGAEYFCIDAGWYDNGNNWWDSVGEWQPSTTRFPNGLSEVTDYIRNAGMIPGLWLEPEVVGVRSSMIERLPKEAFMMRHGVPIVEHGRRLLDFRHQAVRDHLDSVVDRLISEFDIGFFKLDYNVTPGQGTDHDAPSPGAGLMAHSQAHIAWLDGLIERHPELIIENCASGAQRADYALLSRLHLQSTSDQQDPLRYAPVAAAVPLTILPEQAGNWAYPQPFMSDEEIAFTMATGLLGRLYLTGHLDKMSDTQRRLVAKGVSLHKAIRYELAQAVPIWPTGLPNWRDSNMAVGFKTDSVTYVTVWSRKEPRTEIELSLPHLANAEIAVEEIYPGSEATEWDWNWDRKHAVLRGFPSNIPSARVLKLVVR